MVRLNLLRVQVYPVVRYLQFLFVLRVLRLTDKFRGGVADYLQHLLPTPFYAERIRDCRNEKWGMYDGFVRIARGEYVTSAGDSPWLTSGVMSSRSGNTVTIRRRCSTSCANPTEMTPGWRNRSPEILDYPDMWAMAASQSEV